MKIQNREGLFDEEYTSGASRPRTNQLQDDMSDDDDDDEMDAVEDEELEQDIAVLSSLSLAELKDFSSESFSKSSQFIEVKGKDGVPKLLRKSSVVWFLESNVQKLSSDRNFRVRQPNAYNHTSRIIVRVEKEIIFPGDWCIFNREDRNGYLVGNVLLLSHLDGRKEPIYSWKSSAEMNGENVGALCNWFTLDMSTGELQTISGINHGFHPCSFYVVSIPPPSFLLSNGGNATLSLSKEVVQSIRNRV